MTIALKSVATKWGGHSDNEVLAARIYNHVRVEHEELAASRVTFDAEMYSDVNKSSGMVLVFGRLEQGIVVEVVGLNQGVYFR
jgi:hypothetical protein